MCVAGITNQSELLDLARSFGHPLPSPTGELIKELTPTQRAGARKGTLSATFADQAFPLHTDTAFWPEPARYVLLRACGDIRRHTSVLRFEDLFRAGSADLRTLAAQSIWLVKTPSKAFYCSMRLTVGDVSGWRYDGQCMSPVNEAGIEVQKQLGILLPSCREEHINWTGDMAVILCNWMVLHGRGPSPPKENKRILERIYVG
jgi:hypothetical protein